MSWTKGEIIAQALEEIGIQSYSFDSTASQLQSALRQLDTMMGVWISRGIVFDPVYPVSTTLADNSVAEDTNAPLQAIAAMYLNLAVMIAPSYGKTTSNLTNMNAKAFYSNLLGEYAVGNPYELGDFLRGAAGKRPLYPWSRNEPVDINTLIPE